MKSAQQSPGHLQEKFGPIRPFILGPMVLEPIFYKLLKNVPMGLKKCESSGDVFFAKKGENWKTCFGHIRGQKRPQNMTPFYTLLKVIPMSVKTSLSWIQWKLFAKLTKTWILTYFNPICCKKIPKTWAFFFFFFLGGGLLNVDLLSLKTSFMWIQLKTLQNRQKNWLLTYAFYILLKIIPVNLKTQTKPKKGFMWIQLKLLKIKQKTKYLPNLGFIRDQKGPQKWPWRP